MQTYSLSSQHETGHHWTFAVATVMLIVLVLPIMLIRNRSEKDGAF